MRFRTPRSAADNDPRRRSIPSFSLESSLRYEGSPLLATVTKAHIVVGGKKPTEARNKKKRRIIGRCSHLRTPLSPLVGGLVFGRMCWHHAHVYDVMRGPRRVVTTSLITVNITQEQPLLHVRAEESVSMKAILLVPSTLLLSSRSPFFLSSAASSSPPTGPLNPSLKSVNGRPATATSHALSMASRTPGQHGANASASSKRGTRFSPRTESLIFMSAGMALHFGGYEFIRNSCLALFTSSTLGFTSSAAFPLANGLISPFSVGLLYLYTQQLDAHGPRIALRRSTLASIAAILTFAASISVCQQIGSSPKVVSQAIIGLAFLFQSSYQYLLYTQQWSFVTSLMTPDEGSRWFATIAGVSSVVSSVCGRLLPYLVPRTKLLGLMALTAVTLTGSLLCQERAYGLAHVHGFDPSTQQKKAVSGAAPNKSSANRFDKARQLFSRVPTLRALFLEVISFQSLNTILNVAFVAALKATIPNDLERSSYTGRLYSSINAVSAVIQFLVLPTVMRFAEPIWIWRLMPVVPVIVCGLQAAKGTHSLPLLAAAFFLSKTLDYSVRSVVYAMVYQPLDFESRYVGKEIIGVFGSRFGKSGMSLVLSALTIVFGERFGFAQLVQLSVLASSTWLSSAVWLSNLLPRKADAQRIVEERLQGQGVQSQAEQDNKKSGNHNKDS